MTFHEDSNMTHLAWNFMGEDSDNNRNVLFFLTRSKTNSDGESIKKIMYEAWNKNKISWTFLALQVVNPFPPASKWFTMINQKLLLSLWQLLILNWFLSRKRIHFYEIWIILFICDHFLIKLLLYVVFLWLLMLMSTARRMLIITPMCMYYSEPHESSLNYEESANSEDEG